MSTMKATLVKLINRMNCERQLFFFLFFPSREKYLNEMENEAKANKGTLNTDSRRKRYRTNHYVAEKEVNLQHLSVDSETKH